MPKVPYPYEVNGKLVTGNGSLKPICSLSNRSLMPSLTVQKNSNFWQVLPQKLCKSVQECSKFQSDIACLIMGCTHESKSQAHFKNYCVNLVL